MSRCTLVMTQIFDTDVVNLQRQITGALADGSKSKVVLGTNGDRRARWLDEGEYAAAERGSSQLAFLKRQVKHRCARKMKIVEDTPVGASVDGAQHAEVCSRIENGRGLAPIERNGIERQVKSRRDVRPGRCCKRSPEDMPSWETAQPTEHGVDGCRIIGIESDAPDESAGQVPCDVREVQALRARAHPWKPEPVLRRRPRRCCC